MAAESQLRPDPGGQFASDAHRRVAGNLSVPLNLEQLRALLADDPNFSQAALEPKVLARIVADLRRDGHVKSLGSHDDAEALVKAVKADNDVPTLHRDKAAHFVLRAQPRGFGEPQHVVEGEQLYFTNDGVKTLEAPLPDEPPPLEGARLKVAAVQDEVLQAEIDEAVRANAEAEIARLDEEKGRVQKLLAKLKGGSK